MKQKENITRQKLLWWSARQTDQSVSECGVCILIETLHLMSVFDVTLWNQPSLLGISCHYFETMKNVCFTCRLYFIRPTGIQYKKYTQSAFRASILRKDIYLRLVRWSKSWWQQLESGDFKCFLCKLSNYTFGMWNCIADIIGHSVRIIDLLSHTTYVLCINFTFTLPTT